MPQPKDKTKVKDWKEKISNSLKGRRCCMKTEFKKGSISWNKGKKGLTKANKTSFKKGHKPKNYMGGLRVSDRDGIYIRCEDYKYDNGKRIVGKYESLARYNWKKKFGKIPKNSIIFHKDLDRLNNDIQNLELISRKELLKRNQYKNKKDCIICGLEFIARRKTDKTCSKICNREYNRLLTKEYMKKNKEKHRLYNKKYREKQKQNEK
jgi:hypothetical protein